MTAGTSREAVGALIATGDEYVDAMVGGESENWTRLVNHVLASTEALRALLDERDGALAGATTLPHEAAMAGTAGEFAARWNSYAPEKREQAWAGIRAGLDRGNACFTDMHDDRIRDLEAEARKAKVRIHSLELTNERGAQRAANFQRREVAAWAERDRLTAKLDAVKALVEPIAANPNALDALAAGERGMASAVLAILADTDEGKAEQ